MNIYDTLITVSTARADDFVNFYPQTIMFKQMVDIVHAPCKYSAATFKDNRRRMSNFNGRADIIILDFDEGFPDEYFDIFDKYVGIIAPTRSHMKDKKGLICPRYRVILLLKTPLIAKPSAYKRVYKHIISDLKVKADYACVDASRFYFGSEDNKHLTRFLKGKELFDWTSYDYDDFQYVSLTKPKYIDIEPYKDIDVSFIDDLNPSKRYECPICALTNEDKNKHHLGFEKDKQIITCFYNEEHSQILRKLYYNQYNKNNSEEEELGKERCTVDMIPVVTRYPKPTNYSDNLLLMYDKALDELEKAPVIFLDTETFSEKSVNMTLEEAQIAFKDYSYVKPAYNKAAKQFDEVALDPLANRIRLLQLGDGKTFVPFDVYFMRPDQLGRALNIIKNSFIVGQNLKFDFKGIINKFGEQYLPTYCFDTMIASKLLHNAVDYELDPMGHNLGAIAKRICNIDMVKDQGASDWGRDNLTNDQIRYAIEDIKVLPHIYSKMMTDKIPSIYGKFNDPHYDLSELAFLGPLMNVHPIFAIEMQFVIELSKLECNGVMPNRAFLEDTLRRYQLRLEEIEKYLGINVKSAPQCVKLLQERVDPLITGSSKDVLRAYSGNAICDMISEGKSQSTRCGLIKSMLNTHPYDGRLHSSFNQMLSTGRLSSKDPNMQQIPRTLKNYIYDTAEGYTISDADYPAVELRIESIVANDKVMINAYKEGKDLHYITAKGIFSKPIPSTPEEKHQAEIDGSFITKEERGKGKQANFGLIYGMIAETLKDYYKAQGVEISVEEAVTIRSAFMNLYPDVAKAIENAYATFMQGTEMPKLVLTKEGSFTKDVAYYTQVQTLLGRKTTVETPNKMLNYPVQGSGADIAKLAVCKIAYDWKQAGLHAKMINMIHDDIVYEARNDEYEESKKIFVDGMGFAVNYVLRRAFNTDMNKEFTDLSKDGKMLVELME